MTAVRVSMRMDVCSVRRARGALRITRRDLILAGWNTLRLGHWPPHAGGMRVREISFRMFMPERGRSRNQRRRCQQRQDCEKSKSNGIAHW